MRSVKRKGIIDICLILQFQVGFKKDTSNKKNFIKTTNTTEQFEKE